jgi:glycosyltransferase involved in cell wall biosynthesis
MKILLISHSDNIGGANKASYRLFKSLYSIVSIEILCRYKTIKNNRINNLIKPNIILSKIRDRIGNLISKLYINHEKILNKPYLSGNWLYSNWSRKINASKFDIVNTHWIGSETLSLNDLGKIKKPLILTLHDMWFFCGMEHYYNLNQFKMNFRWMNKIKSEKFYLFDLSKIVFNKKKKLANISHIVTPSNWLRDYCLKSTILKNNKITTIPNPVKTNIYKPGNYKSIRKKLNIKDDEKIILFGSSSPLNVEAKGFLKLVEIFKELKKITNFKIKVLIFGDTRDLDSYSIPFKYFDYGYLNDDTKLIELYSCCDVLVMPSILDNLPQIATEGQSCGCPIVSFETGGLPEIVDHKINGLLTKKFNIKEFAKNIQKIFAMKDSKIKKMKIAARKKAISHWNEKIIAKQYYNLYKKILNENK